jgi:hypothetical protein
MSSHPTTEGALIAIRLRLRPSQSISAPDSRHPTEIAMAERDAVKQIFFSQGQGPSRVVTVSSDLQHSPIHDACSSDTCGCLSVRCIAGSATAEKPKVTPAVTVAIVATAQIANCCKIKNNTGRYGSDVRLEETA